MENLILRCDDFCSATGANDAILELAATGLTMNVSVLICGPAVKYRLDELAAFAPKVCLGIHAAVTSEWDKVKWGPVSVHGKESGLVDDRGFFHPTTRQVQPVPVDTISDEVRAQIELAMGWGIPFSYLDEHMGFGWISGVSDQLRNLRRNFVSFIGRICPPSNWSRKTTRTLSSTGKR